MGGGSLNVACALTCVHVCEPIYVMAKCHADTVAWAQMASWTAHTGSAGSVLSPPQTIHIQSSDAGRLLGSDPTGIHAYSLTPDLHLKQPDR